MVTGKLSWRKLYHLVVNLPADAATIRARVGDSAAWSVEAHLLAVLLDATNAANWQRAGRRNAPKPKQVQRPGQHRSGRHIGRGAGMGIGEFDAFYQKARANATEWVEEVIDDGS